MSPTVPPRLHNDHAGVAIPPDSANALLDLVGHVGDGLNGAAQVDAPSLLGNHRLVDLAGGHGAGLGEVLIQEALVVAQVEVGFGAVAGDENLAVLVGGHGAGVDVEVGVQFLDDDGDVASLEESADGGGGDPFPYGTHHPTSDEDVLRHVIQNHHTGDGEGLSSAGGVWELAKEID